MKIFLLDLWQDLRDKRLWPVAVVLLAGLVAVPVLVAKPAAEPAAPTVPAANLPEDTKREALAALAKVKLGEDAGAKGSTLGVFDPDNPFKLPKGAMKEESSDSSAGSPGDGTSAGGDNSSSGGSGSDDGSGTTGGGTTGGTPGGGTTGGGTPGGQTETKVYKYVVDAKFTANGRTRRVRGLEKLDMLPSESSPLLIFMGVTAKGSDAVFLVDSTLEAAGEGRCKPSPSECAFAYIGPGSEYVFTEEDGDTYTIQIEEIRKVEVTDEPTSARSTKARASVGPTRRFVPPVLADVVVVASERLENSTSDTDSR
jgi:hypothetical protein